MKSGENLASRKAPTENLPGIIDSEFVITPRTTSRPQKLFAVNHYFVSQDFF